MSKDLTAEQIIEAVRKLGTVKLAAKHFNMPRQTLDTRIGALGCRDRVRAASWKQATAEAFGERPGITMTGDECTITSSIDLKDLGDVDELICSRGLDPADWIVLYTTVNEWDAMTSDKATGDNRVVQMRQLKIVLKRKISMMIISPAVDVPRILKVGKLRTAEPEYILVEGDHQAPYHDLGLHAASLALLQLLEPEEQIFIGDTSDLPTISRFQDHPAAMASVNECIQATYDLLRDKAEASPATRRRKLKGNHDWRIESELLARAERMYGVRPADTGSGAELPALALQRLLHLDALGIELVENPLGWQHAEIEIIPGPEGLVGRHGWLTGHNTAERSMKKRGRSMLVGHTHGREHSYWWDPSMECLRQAAVIAAMCLVRNKRFPHFAVCDDWQQGPAVVSRWPDNRFLIEHVCWDGESLLWRNERIYGE